VRPVSRGNVEVVGTGRQRLVCYYLDFRPAFVKISILAVVVFLVVFPLLTKGNGPPFVFLLAVTVIGIVWVFGIGYVVGVLSFRPLVKKAIDLASLIAQVDVQPHE
jgi:hypothetical protein